MFALSTRNILERHLGMMVNVIDPDHNFYFLYTTIQKLVYKSDFMTEQGIVMKSIHEINQAYMENCNNDDDIIAIAKLPLVSCLTIAILAKRESNIEDGKLTRKEREVINDFYYAVRSFACGKCFEAGGDPEDVSMYMLQASSVDEKLFEYNYDKADSTLTAIVGHDRKYKLLPLIISELSGIR
jgi:hypothetical protein